MGSEHNVEVFQQLSCQSAQCHAGSGLSRRSPLQYIAHVVMVVLDGSRKVSVARSGSGGLRGKPFLFQWQVFSHWVDRVHNLSPVIPISVVYHKRDGTTHGIASPYPGNNFDFVLFDFHPPASAIPLLPASQLVVDALYIDRETGWKAVYNSSELRAMRFT